MCSTPVLHNLQCPEPLILLGFRVDWKIKNYTCSPHQFSPKSRVCFWVHSFRVSKGDFLKFPKEISGCFQKKLLDVSRIELMSSLAVIRSPADKTSVLRHYKHAVRVRAAALGCSAISRSLSRARHDPFSLVLKLGLRFQSSFTAEITFNSSKGHPAKANRNAIISNAGIMPGIMH